MRTISSLLLASSTLLYTAKSFADERVQGIQDGTVTALRSTVQSVSDATSAKGGIMQQSDVQPMTVTEQEEITTELHESTAEVNRVLEAATEDVWGNFPEYAELQLLLQNQSSVDTKHIQDDLDTLLQSLLTDGLTVDETVQLKTEIIKVIQTLQMANVRRQEVALQTKTNKRSVHTKPPWYLNHKILLLGIFAITTAGQIIHAIQFRRNKNFPKNI